MQAVLSVDYGLEGPSRVMEGGIMLLALQRLACTREGLKSHSFSRTRRGGKSSWLRRSCGLVLNQLPPCVLGTFFLIFFCPNHVALACAGPVPGEGTTECNSKRLQSAVKRREVRIAFRLQLQQFLLSACSETYSRAL